MTSSFATFCTHFCLFTKDQVTRLISLENQGTDENTHQHDWISLLHLPTLLLENIANISTLLTISEHKLYYITIQYFSQGGTKRVAVVVPLPGKTYHSRKFHEESFLPGNFRKLEFKRLIKQELFVKKAGNQVNQENHVCL